MGSVYRITVNLFIRPWNAWTVHAELVEAHKTFRQAQGERKLRLHKAGSIVADYLRKTKLRESITVAVGTDKIADYYKYIKIGPEQIVIEKKCLKWWNFNLQNYLNF